MGQEFIIKSQNLEDKINQLLPSQGGFAAGVDLSASTTIIPIVDLTELAEGGNVRQDLQTDFSLKSITEYDVQNTTTTIITTTGYFRVFGIINLENSGSPRAEFRLTDGTTNKDIFAGRHTGSASATTTSYDFITFLEAGDSLQVIASATARVIGCSRQVADISGNLVNP